MNDIVRDFLLESHESLAQLDLDLVTLEKEPSERETLARVFRTIHTVKGTAGFLGLAKLQSVSHAAETLLGRLRAGELTFNAEIANALLGVVDAIRQMLARLEVTGQEGDGDYSTQVQALERLTRAPGSSRVRKVPTPPPEPGPPAQVPLTALPEPPRAATSDEESRVPHISDTSVRVDIGLLDTLMTLVGELVLARNQIIQFNSAQEGTAYHSAVQRLNALTTELQAGVTKTRMQPIGNLWAKFPRLVRDLAVTCGKQVRLEMEGHETELDRSIIEAVRDPLTHMVRNAVDHGIEAPAVRAATGKPSEGRGRLHAFHEGGKVVIEITDDGAGIDPFRVRDKALAVNLITHERAAGMTERELLRLIFLPGFSTADRVSQLSGRGVGMDVVRTNIEKIGGTVDLDSRRGLGTTVRMRIPLTLAIIPALIVTTGGDRYAIPQVNLIELLRIDGAVTWGAVENVHGAPVYRLRDTLLPLVYLHRELGVEPVDDPGDTLHVVVVQADDYRFGLVVDAIYDAEEIVVKPLQKPLKPVGVFAGATIMGDGQVALILDVLGVGQRARAAGGGSEPAASRLALASQTTAAEREAVLLFTPGASGKGRMAVPLARVARLEEFPRTAVERVGDREVVQYRGEILPLVRVARAFARRGTGTRRRRAVPGDDLLRVVVYASDQRRVGLVVGRVLDIVEEAITARSAPVRAGILFNAVVQGFVTEFLDVERLVRAAGEVPS